MKAWANIWNKSSKVETVKSGGVLKSGIQSETLDLTYQKRDILHAIRRRVTKVGEIYKNGSNQNNGKVVYTYH